MQSPLFIFAYFFTDQDPANFEMQDMENTDDTRKDNNKYCPHYKRSSCLFHFKCCDEGMFFPCHKCHNEFIEKKNINKDAEDESEDCSETVIQNHPQATCLDAEDESEDCNETVIQNHPQATCLDAVSFQCTLCKNGSITDIKELSEKCKQCKERLASYVCVKCLLLVNDKALDPYHCEDCGLCRVNKSKSFHCSKCNICLDKKMKNNHKCLENSGRDKCAVCMEGVFVGCIILPCSHKFHRSCLESLLHHGGFNCPNCRQCFIPDKNNKEPSFPSRIWSYLCGRNNRL